MADLLHSSLGSADGTERHPDLIWTVADQTAREVLSGQTTAQIGGTLWQQDNDSFWKLKSIGPNVWIPIAASGSGNVIGPASATNNALVRFDTTTGKLIQDSDITVDDDGNLSTVGTVDGRDVAADGTAHDAHIAAANPHSGSAASSSLTSHTGDATIHFVEGSIDHTAITNVGTNTHAQVDTHLASTANPHSVTAAQAGAAETEHQHLEEDITDLSHTDPDAIHDNVAGEIVAVTLKATPTTSDLLLIEDAADSNNKKRITIATLPGGGGGSGDVVGPASATDNAVARFNTTTGKLIQDSALVVDDSGNITSVGTVDGRDIDADGTAQDAHIAAANPHSGSASSSDLTTHTSDATNPHSVTAAQAGAAETEHQHLEEDITDLSHVDPNAIHDNVASEISAVTLKASPTTSDLLLIEDAADTNNKKRVTIGSVLGGGGLGDVVGPASATDNALVRFDTTTGNLVQNSSVVADDSGNITTVGTVDGRDVAADGTAQDNHIAASNPHSDSASDTDLTAHTGAANPHSGSASTTDLSTHTSDTTIHFTEASIDHTAIANIGTNTHAQIDTHIGAANPHSGSASSSDLTTHTSDTTIHYTEASIDHTAISNIGTNTHAQIDTYIASRPAVVDPTDLSDGEYYSFGPVLDVTVDENSVGFGAVLAINFSDGHYDMANASDGDGQISYPAIAVETGTGTRQIIRAGIVRKDAWNWTVGGELWISNTNGTLTQTTPTSPNYLKSVGYAITADIIWFEPSGAALKLTT